MMCPRCEEGELKAIFFKAERKKAYVCDTCDALWFEGEEKNSATARTLSAYVDATGHEYSFDDIDELDHEHRKTIPEQEKRGEQ